MVCLLFPSHRHCHHNRGNCPCPLLGCQAAFTTMPLLASAGSHLHPLPGFQLHTHAVSSYGQRPRGGPGAAGRSHWRAAGIGVPCTRPGGVQLVQTRSLQGSTAQGGALVWPDSGQAPKHAGRQIVQAAPWGYATSERVLVSAMQRAVHSCIGSVAPEYSRRHGRALAWPPDAMWPSVPPRTDFVPCRVQRGAGGASWTCTWRARRRRRGGRAPCT